MAEVIKPGQIMQPVFGMGSASKSLGRAPQPFISVMIKVPSGTQEDVLIIHGDEATADFIDRINVPWGSEIPTVWDALQTGYSYEWEINKGTLTIRDGASSVISTRAILNWCDLALEANIVESHQFTYVFSGSIREGLFPLARKYIRQTKSIKEEYSWGVTDRFIDPAVTPEMVDEYPKYYLCCESGAKTAEDYAYSLFSKAVELRGVLSALIVNLSQSADYAINLMEKEKDGHGQKIIVIKRTIMNLKGKYLMLYAVTDNLLSMDKPVFEPWMLWMMYKWTTKGNHDYDEDRIFDLSPWWGS